MANRELSASWQDNMLTCWYGSHDGMRLTVVQAGPCTYDVIAAHTQAHPGSETWIRDRQMRLQSTNRDAARYEAVAILERDLAGLLEDVRLTIE